MRERPAAYLCKRLLDVTVSGLMLLALSPLLVLVGVAVAVHFRAVPIFTQPRAGKGGVSFDVCKFRSMRDGRDSAGKLLPDARRMTDFGNWLRATSLDELPQLFNVLLGDMSLVGPRPLPLNFLDRFGAMERERLGALPGITGWVQVNGRNSLTWDEKFRLDAWYVRNWSFGLDVSILLRTIPTVLLRRDINHRGAATSATFRGANPSGEA